MDKIFLIDDLSSIADLFTDFLSSKGYEVEVAYNIDEFKRRVNYLVPDLIIYDTDMPISESKKFIKIWENHPFLDNIPKIFLTGFVDESKLEKFSNLKNCEFINKNSSFAYIINRIRNVLNNKNSDLVDYRLSDTAFTQH